MAPRLRGWRRMHAVVGAASFELVPCGRKNTGALQAKKSVVALWFPRGCMFPRWPRPPYFRHTAPNPLLDSPLLAGIPLGPSEAGTRERTDAGDGCRCVKSHTHEGGKQKGIRVRTPLGPALELFEVCTRCQSGFVSVCDETPRCCQSLLLLHATAGRVCCFRCVVC